MAFYKYSYSLEQFLNNKADLPKLTTEISESDITVSLGYITSEDSIIDCFFRNTLDSADWTTLSGVVALHDGESSMADDVQYVDIKATDIKLPVDISDELRDRSGKLRVHQTSRKIGTVILWTGVGDDPTDSSSIGGGAPFSFSYTAGQQDPLIKYIDFNCVENETWLHEGYITWKDCYLDTLDLQVVPRVTSTAVGTGTNYNLYGGYLIVPAASGTGTLEITGDIANHDGGLVFMPPNDQGNIGTAFWNADWDTATKKFINITPAPLGDGTYNMFATEVVIAHFVRQMPLLNSGFIPLNSSDTDQLGHGMRLKMIADTNTTFSGIGDHNWAVACTMCMHREKTV